MEGALTPPIAPNAAIMAAQDRLHVLVKDKSRPTQPAEAEHE
jgi:hypothetical protein